MNRNIKTFFQVSWIVVALVDIGAAGIFFVHGSFLSSAPVFLAGIGALMGALVIVPRSFHAPAELA